MGHRFYFTSTTSSVTPANWYNTRWQDRPSSDTPRVLATTKTTSTATTVAESELMATRGGLAICRFVSDPLPETKTLAGTFKCYLRVEQNTIDAELCSQIVIRVFTGDGSTERGILYAGDTQANTISNEWAITDTNRAFPRLALYGADGVALTPVEVQAGDRIVIELGAKFVNVSSVTTTGWISIGGGSGTADLPEDETTTTALLGWIEFSQSPWPEIIANVDAPAQLGIVAYAPTVTAATPTRFYFTSIPSAVTPAASPLWAQGPPAGNYVQLSPVKTGSAFANFSQTEPTSEIAQHEECVAVAVSTPLSAQTITGAVTCYIRAMESNSSANYFSQIVIRAVSGDGSTERGVLYAGDSGSTTIEWSSILAYSQAFPRTSLPAVLSPVAIEEGDRLVVEIGFTAAQSSNTSFTGTVVLGDPIATADLDYNSQAVDIEGVGWIDFAIPLLVTTTEPVSADLVARWNMRAAVGNNLAASWDVNAPAAGNNLVLSWNVAPMLVQRDLAASWNVRLPPWPQIHTTSDWSYDVGTGAIGAITDTVTAPVDSLLIACVLITTDQYTGMEVYSSEALIWTQYAVSVGPNQVLIYTAPFIEGGDIHVVAQADITAGSNQVIAAKMYVLTGADLVNPTGNAVATTSADDPATLSYITTARLTRPFAVAIDAGTRVLTTPDIGDSITVTSPPLSGIAAHSTFGTNEIGENATIIIDPDGAGTLNAAMVEIRPAYFTGTATAVTWDADLTAGPGIAETGLTIGTLFAVTGSGQAIAHSGTGSITATITLGAAGTVVAESGISQISWTTTLDNAEGQSERAGDGTLSGSIMLAGQGGSERTGTGQLDTGADLFSQGLIGYAGAGTVEVGTDIIDGDGVSARHGDSQIIAEVALTSTTDRSIAGTGTISVGSGLSGRGGQATAGTGQITVDTLLDATGMPGVPSDNQIYLRYRLRSLGKGHHRGTGIIGAVSEVYGESLAGSGHIDLGVTITGQGETPTPDTGEIATTAILSGDGIKAGDGSGQVAVDITDASGGNKHGFGTTTIGFTATAESTGTKHAYGTGGIDDQPLDLRGIGSKHANGDASLLVDIAVIGGGALGDPVIVTVVITGDGGKIFDGTSETGAMFDLVSSDGYKRGEGAVLIPVGTDIGYEAFRTGSGMGGIDMSVAALTGHGLGVEGDWMVRAPRIEVLQRKGLDSRVRR